jgi:2-amino-4-hydroxy-6-hydroxymethyldihydropteridine diphosphokinase
LQAIENQQGRVRTQRWGPRTLDLDLLLFGDSIVQSDTLTVPHPEMHRRAFVLYPLYEIAADIEIPGQGWIEQLLRGIDPGLVEKLDQA